MEKDINTWKLNILSFASDNFVSDRVTAIETVSKWNFIKIDQQGDTYPWKIWRAQIGLFTNS